MEDKSTTPGKRVKFIRDSTPPSAVAPRPAGETRERAKVRFAGVARPPAARGQLGISRPAPADGSPEYQCSTIPEIAYTLPDGNGVRVTISDPACAGIAVHCAESRTHGREVGGVLVGHHSFCRKPGGRGEHSVLVTDLIPIQAGSSSASHVRFDEADWDYVERQMESLHAGDGKCRVGWYHTHPTQGIFFSNYDRDAHSIFQQPFQFALVVDPRTMDAGLFHWADHGARRLGGPFRFRLEPAVLPEEQRPPAEWPRAVVLITGACATAGSAMVWAPGWNVALLAICTLGFAGWMIVRFWNPQWQRWSAIAVPALALLVFSAGLHNGQLRERRYLSQASQPAPTISRSVPQTASHHPASGAIASSVVESPPAVPRARVRFLVQESARGRRNRIILLSGDRQVAVNYRLRDCGQNASGMELRSCRIAVDPRKEQAFLRAMFAPRTERAAWQSLQRSLGMQGAQVDGLWGRITRTRFLQAATSRARGGPLEIDLPRVGPADVVFEAAARKKKAHV